MHGGVRRGGSVCSGAPLASRRGDPRWGGGGGFYVRELRAAAAGGAEAGVARPGGGGVGGGAGSRRGVGYRQGAASRGLGPRGGHIAYCRWYGVHHRLQRLVAGGAVEYPIPQA